MTSSVITNMTGAQEARPWITARGWVWIGVITVLFSALHWNFLYRSLKISLSDNNWSHALLVPVIGLYYLYQNRARLMAMRGRVSWWGLPVMLAGMGSYAFWIYPGRNDMFQGYSMIVALFGLVLFLLGPRMMTVLWFPIVYLGFGVKVAQKLWELIALKLQGIASVSSTVLLNIIGLFLDLEASVRGNTIELFHKGVPLYPPMNVAEACSGLRMLMAFLALGVAMAFLAPRAWWQRAVMVGMTLPIAVAVNVGRVTALGLLKVYAPKYATGDFHIFVGMLMLIPAALMFLLLGWVLEKIIVADEASPEPAESPAAVPFRADEPTEADASMVVKGVLFGVSLTALALGGYALLITLIRPDIAADQLGGAESLYRPIAGGGLLLAGLLLWLAVKFLGLRLIPSGPEVSPGRKRGAAMSVSIGLLAAALAGQQALVMANSVVMHKQSVPLRMSLDRLEHPTGKWRFVKQDPPLSKDIVDELGTEEYVNRTYEDTTWLQGPRGRYADVHIAYYTGTPDTVPHVPQQCFKAGGLVQVAGGPVSLKMDPAGYSEDPDVPGGYLHPVAENRFTSETRVPGLDIPATYFTFANPNRGGDKVNVAYFFVANGKFLAGPNEVRLNGFDLRDKYSYYCKVQVTVGVQDQKLAAERIASLLTEIMPEIMLCLPDWIDVTEGRWPAEDPAGVPAEAGPGE
jgi:exosortase